MRIHPSAAASRKRQSVRRLRLRPTKLTPSARWQAARLLRRILSASAIPFNLPTSMETIQDRIARANCQQSAARADYLDTSSCCDRFADNLQCTAKFSDGTVEMDSRVGAEYLVETAYPLEAAAEAMAGEQSSGTFVRLPSETDALRENSRGTRRGNTRNRVRSGPVPSKRWRAEGRQRFTGLSASDRQPLVAGCEYWAFATELACDARRKSI